MQTDFDVAIIGAGFGGLCMAKHLAEEGRRRFVVLEREADVGGTWRVNTYPGCACDVPSHLYSYSFEPNPRWSRSYSPQPQIRAYLEHVADKYRLRENIRCSTEVKRLRFDDDGQHWVVALADGTSLTAVHVVTATGALSVPRWPDIDGLDTFAGTRFHSQRWNHDHDLAGRRVAVVGTGASAIQFVPQIAPTVASLTVFQRSPPWILPKGEHAIGPAAQRLYAALPGVQNALRYAIYWSWESRALAFTRWRWLGPLVAWRARRYLHAQVPDRELARKLTPDYGFGCKRVLLSNDYYPALTRPNVQLVDQPVVRVTPRSVVAADGAEFEVDTLILGTGFRAADPWPRGFISGRGGVDILDAWRDGPEAYLGTVVHGFPNLFMLAGPNTGLGHSSMIFMLESQVRFVMSALAAVADGRLDRVEVRSDVQRDYNRRLQAALASSVWQAGGCRSWYQAANGKNVALWPGFTWQFRRRTRTIRPREFHQAGVGAAPAAGRAADLRSHASRTESP